MTDMTTLSPKTIRTHSIAHQILLLSFQSRAFIVHNTAASKEVWQCRQVLTRSMLRRGLALLRIRMICLIWVCVTRLLMQPNTTRARGCRDGLYWNANLHVKHTQTSSSWIWLEHIPVNSNFISKLFQNSFLQSRVYILLRQIGPLVQPFTTWNVPHTCLNTKGKPSQTI